MEKWTKNNGCSCPVAEIELSDQALSLQVRPFTLQAAPRAKLSPALSRLSFIRHNYLVTHAFAGGQQGSITCGEATSGEATLWRAFQAAKSRRPRFGE
jgi:hypothetical protein